MALAISSFISEISLIPFFKVLKSLDKSSAILEQPDPVLPVKPIIEKLLLSLYNSVKSIFL